MKIVDNIIHKLALETHYNIISLSDSGCVRVYICMFYEQRVAVFFSLFGLFRSSFARSVCGVVLMLCCLFLYEWGECEVE